MQAFHLIKAISSILNEDKFATYTLKQVYDELGRDDFVDYIKTTTIKIINNTEILKDAELDTRIGTLHMYFIFTKDMPRYTEKLYIKIYQGSGLLAMYSEVGGIGQAPDVVFERNATNVVKLLQDGINKCINSKKMIKMRKAAESS